MTRFSAEIVIIELEKSYMIRRKLDGNYRF
jgi:hypothetical protein